MAGIRTKVELFDRTVLFDADAVGTERSKLLADFAREQLADAQAINRSGTGHDVDFDTFVDGVEGAPLERVRPDGTIVFEFHQTSEVIQYVYGLIVKNSPVGRKRQYIASHRIYADGVEVASPVLAAGAAEVIITTVVPYARKIEGIAGRPPQSSQAPEGVYEVSAVMGNRRYGNVARIKFTYRLPTGGMTSLDAWAVANAAKHANARKRRSEYQRNIRQPAVIITFR